MSFLRARAGRLSGWLTVLGTVMVVVLEFMLLTSVYLRAAPVNQEAAIVASLSGQWNAVGPDRLPAVKQSTEGDVDKLQRLGLSEKVLTAIRIDASRAEVTGSTVSGASRVEDAVASLATRVQAEKRRIDSEAEIFYAFLLVVASLGWMVWFRRLVGRHRSLEHRLTEQAAKTEGEQRLAALVRNASDVVVLCDLDGRLRFVTPSARAVLGRAPDDLLGTPLADLVHPDDLDRFVCLLATIPDNEDRPLQLRLHHGDGRVLHVEGTVSNLLCDPSVSGISVTLRDQTDRVELEAQLTYQAFHDSLTSLANRQLFKDRLEHALARREGTQRPLVVLFCDLDEFKNINDSRGHATGDEVLRHVARQAAQTIRPGDTIARLGGDEFAVLLEDTDLAGGLAMAERLLGAFECRVSVDGRPVSTRASIGLAAAIPGSVTGDDVLRQADVAMYTAKDRGKGQVAVYEAQAHAVALDRMAIASDLQRALRNEELSLHYQPSVDLATGRIAGFEALVRWNDPERGPVPPVAFIPIAERTGLIHPLGRWVLSAACRAATALCVEGRTMSVNVSSQQLERDDFVNEVFAILHDTGLDASRLTLEITETALLKDFQTIVGRLQVLRRSGIKIAIDDFGTGYNSLSYLRDLPIDVLKIDKSFVDNVTTSHHEASLTEAILRMSSTMALVTIAEGVEHPQQAEWLNRTDCKYGQGYLWSKPVPYEQALELVDRQTCLSPAAAV